jgi:mannose-1-phosphate guanylyltransferase
MMKRASRGTHVLENNAVEAAPLCGLVLAGGEGQRLRSFVARLRGDALPKQYVNFSGSRSMIEHTFRRVETFIPRERLFTIVNQTHLNFPEVNHQLSDRHRGTVIVQPTNLETGSGLLLALTYIRKSYPNAIVAVFPSDQFVLEADRLMRHIQLAYAIVERRPSSLILLGMIPDYDEPDYGYIVPETGRDSSGWGIRNVRTFIEKPNRLRASELIRQGALWNTMLFVFNIATILAWVHELEPELYGHFERIYDAIGTHREASLIYATYCNGLRAVNFSKELLEPIAERYPGRLAVLPVTDVTWSDWGTERRIVSTLKNIGRIPCDVTPVPSFQRSHRRVSPKSPSPDRRAVYTL